MRYFVIDAFTDSVFKGNQAGVCLPEGSLDDALMRNIAAENNLAETSFVLPVNGGYELRWFTPEVEMDLCGHGTLASAWVIRHFVDPNADQINFFTKSGLLSVTCIEPLYEMDFPSRPPKRIDTVPAFTDAIGCPVLEAYMSRDLLLLVENEAALRTLTPDLDAMKQFDDGLRISPSLAPVKINNLIAANA